MPPLLVAKTTGAMDDVDYSVIYGTLANFDIEKKIGKGQFSEVYRARCKQDGRIVALKKVQVRYIRIYRYLMMRCWCKSAPCNFCGFNNRIVENNFGSVLKSREHYLILIYNRDIGFLTLNGFFNDS